MIFVIIIDNCWWKLVNNRITLSTSKLLRRFNTAAELVTSSFKFILTRTFPRCGATCYIVASRTMSVQWYQFCESLSGSLLNILQLYASFNQNPKLLQWRLALTTLAICRVMFWTVYLMDRSYWNVDDRNNVDLLLIITRGSNLKFQLTIRVFSIAFGMSVIEKVGEFLNTLTMQYELRYIWWINSVVMILYVPHCLCWLFYIQNIITFLFERLSCAVEILIWSDAVDFLTKSLGMPYSVVTAQQACSTEMVKVHFALKCVFQYQGVTSICPI